MRLTPEMLTRRHSPMRANIENLKLLQNFIIQRRYDTSAMRIAINDQINRKFAFGWLGIRLLPLFTHI